MKLTIHVKKHHIKNGVPISSLKCPVALALEDAGIEYPIVTGAWIIINGNQVNLPPDVKAFIKYYDTRAPSDYLPKPFSFEIEFPDWVIPFKRVILSVADEPENLSILPKLGGGK